MNKLPIEIILEILFLLKDIDSYFNLFLVNKRINNICKQCSSQISKYFLNKYQVDYNDPTNFIYVYKKLNINDYSNDYLKILQLYFSYTGMKKIECYNKKITSIPAFPNLQELHCILNQITTLPKYPNLKKLNCKYNQITTLPKYPKLRVLNCNENKITTLQEYPELQEL